MNKEFKPTDEQKKIIEFDNAQPLLVNAGAGSGKTELLSEKIKYLVEKKNVKPERILGLTFTKKATSELSARVRGKLAQFKVEKKIEFYPKIATYDSFIEEIVMDFGQAVGHDTDIKIIGEPDKYLIAKKVIDEHIGKDVPIDDPIFLTAEGLLKSPEKELVKLSEEVSANLYTVSEIQNEFEKKVIELKKFNIESIKKYENEKEGNSLTERCKEARVVVKTFNRVKKNYEKHLSLCKLLKHYEEEKKIRKLFSFSDLTLTGHNILKNKEIAKEIKKNYDFVILDEYQDTSMAQEEILKAIFNDGFPVLAVGDKNQVLYAWRGANLDGMESFSNDFKNKDGSAPTEMTLSVSFRNDKPILDYANNLLADKDLKLKYRDNFKNGSVDVEMCENNEEEAKKVVNFIEKHKTPDKSAAILVHKRKDFEFVKEELDKKGILYQVDDIAGLLNQPEITDIISILKIVFDKEQASSEIIRFLSGKYTNFTKEDLKNIADSIPKDCKYLADYIFESDIEKKYPKFKMIKKTVNELEKIKDESLVFLCNNIIRKLKIKEILSIKSSFTSKKTQLENISLFLEFVSDFENNNELNSLSDFLNYIDILKNSEDLEMADEPLQGNTNAVQLITIHRAKGLEWDIVACIGNQKTKGVQTVGPGGRVKETVVKEFSKALNRIKDDPDYNETLAGGSEFPYELRLDKKHKVPKIFLTDKESEISKCVKSLEKYNKYYAKQEEKQNLNKAYVGWTRAKNNLLLSSHWQDVDNVSYKCPSKYFYLSFLKKNDIKKVDDKFRDLFLESMPKKPVPKPPIPKEWPTKMSDFQRKYEKVGEKEIGGEVVNSLNLSNDKKQKLKEDYKNVNKPISKSDFEPDHYSPSSLITNKTTDYLRPIPIEQSDGAEIGTIFHSFIENYYRHGSIFMDSDIAKSYKVNLKKRINAFEEWVEKEGGKLGDKKEVEQPFSIKYNVEGRGERIVNGKIDAIFEQSKGNYIIIDWKTYEVEEDKYKKQLEIYEAAVKEMYSDAKNIDSKFICFYKNGEVAEIDKNGNKKVIIASKS